MDILGLTLVAVAIYISGIVLGNLILEGLAKIASEIRKARTIDTDQCGYFDAGSRNIYTVADENGKPITITHQQLLELVKQAEDQ